MITYQTTCNEGKHPICVNLLSGSNCGEIGFITCDMDIRWVVGWVAVVVMVSTVTLCCLVSGLVVGQAWGHPMPLLSESPHPLTLVSDLTSRLGSHPSRLQDAARLSLPSLPSSQDLEAIKKVAQILVMLGQQVIPTIIGESVAPGHCDTVASGGGDVETPNDPVNIDRQS